MKIRINKDFLRDYKDDFWKGFSGREILCLAAAAGTAVLLILLLYFKAGVPPSLAVYLSIPAVFPVVLAGFYRYQGNLSPFRLLQEIVYTWATGQLTFEAGEQPGTRRRFTMQRGKGEKKHGGSARNP